MGGWAGQANKWEDNRTVWGPGSWEEKGQVTVWNHVSDPIQLSYFWSPPQACAVCSDRITVFVLEIKNSFERVNYCSQETCLIRGPSEYVVPDTGPSRKLCSCPIFFPLGCIRVMSWASGTFNPLCLYKKQMTGFYRLMTNFCGFPGSLVCWKDAN